MYWLSRLGVDASYATHVMPALFLASFGLGLAFVPMTLTAVHAVAEDRAGVASALVNMSQQVGAALGLSVFTTISVSAASGRLPDAATALQDGLAGSDTELVARAGEALAHGYTTAVLVGAGMLIIAAFIAIVAINTRRTQATVGAGAMH